MELWQLNCETFQNRFSSIFLSLSAAFFDTWTYFVCTVEMGAVCLFVEGEVDACVAACVLGDTRLGQSGWSHTACSLLSIAAYVPC